MVYYSIPKREQLGFKTRGERIHRVAVMRVFDKAEVAAKDLLAKRAAPAAFWHGCSLVHRFLLKRTIRHWGKILILYFPL